MILFGILSQSTKRLYFVLNIWGTMAP